MTPATIYREHNNRELAEAERHNEMLDSEVFQVAGGWGHMPSTGQTHGYGYGSSSGGRT
jgi:hypothetical protein